MSTLAQEREKARGLATRIVSFSIGLIGVLLMAFAFFLTLYGGAGFLFLSVLLFLLGAGVAAVGFFFQLVPFRLEELASEKREYDVRVREREEERRGKREGGGGAGGSDGAGGGSAGDEPRK